MTEITRVPLQPIAKGSLGKMWLGVVAVLLLAGGIAWAAMPATKSLEGEVLVTTIKQGEGPSPTKNDVALINYVGTLDDGTVFDQNQRVPMPLQGVIPGFSTALSHMQKGGKYKVRIPAAQAYGDVQSGPIPPGSDLNFEIELLEFMDFQQFQQQMAIQQMMQQQAQQRGGAPGAQGGPPPGMPPQP